MSEPTTTSMAPPDEVLNYKPVSGWAILSLGLGATLAGLAGFCFLYDVRANGPIMLPPWLLYPGLIAVVASVVSALVALGQISSSEGTRVGKKLALWGLGLSVVTFLGYFAFYGFTYLALVSQANDFVMKKDAEDNGKPESGFFPRLIEGTTDRTQFNSAFLLAVHPFLRKNADPANDQKMAFAFDVPDAKNAGQMTRFREIKVVKLIHDSVIQAKESSKDWEIAVKVEPLSVVDWTHEEPNNLTPTGIYQVIRTYRITTPEVIATVELPVHSIDVPGERRKWVAEIFRTRELKADYTPLGKAIRELDDQSYDFLRNWVKDLPGGPIPVKSNTSDTKVVPKKIQEKVNEVFQNKEAAACFVIESPANGIVPHWKQIGEKMVIQYPVVMFIPPDQPQHILEGYLALESQTPVDPHNFTNSKVDWKVIHLQWVRAGSSMLK